MEAVDASASEDRGVEEEEDDEEDEERGWDDNGDKEKQRLLSLLLSLSLLRCLYVLLLRLFLF